MLFCLSSLLCSQHTVFSSQHLLPLEKYSSLSPNASTHYNIPPLDLPPPPAHPNTFGLDTMTGPDTAV